jgi:putative peptidoglycan lipid II flippase
MGRVQSVVARANRKLTVQIAAALLSGALLASMVFGIIRIRLLTNFYYDTYPVGLDAYNAAFLLPDFMYFILVSGALSVTFIPVFNQRMASGNKKSAWRLSTSLVNLMALATLVASVLIIIFAEPLIRFVIAPGLSESGTALAVSMMRVIAVNPFLFAVATVIASIQQAVGRFTFYALAPIIYNLGIITGILFFTNGINIFGWQVFDGGIMGVALGVVFGSIMQLIVSSAGLIGLGFDYRFKIYWKNKGFRKVLALLPARSLDQGMDYIVGIVETNLASRMAAGTLTAYNYATTLMMAPINLVGVAISTAAFPQMTQRLSEGRPDLFKSELRTVLRVIIWLSLPIAIITFFTRGYIISFIKNAGDPLMAGLLGALTTVILFRSIYYIAARTFYAQQDTKTPLYISFFSIGLNIFLAVFFTAVLNMGAYGLAWAQSIMAATEVVILFVVMSIRLGGLFDRAFWSSIWRMMSATGFMAIVSYIMVLIMPLQAGDNSSFYFTFPKFVLIVVVSMVTYVGFSRLLKLQEVKPIIATVKRLSPGSVRG